MRFRERALNWNIAQFAIDEAHCISEWGHDFRPEYRELKKLRKHLPDVPLMALTATATERVRADIVKATEIAGPTLLRGQFQSAEPDLSGGSEDGGLTNNCWRSFAAGLTTAASFIVQAARAPNHSHEI